MVSFERAATALIVNAAKIENKAKQLGMALSRASQGVTLTDNGVTVSQPFKQNGSTQMVMLFEMSDGQTISVYLHNPDVKPNQLQGDDVLVSWKWLLNRKDITIVVAKENGKDLALSQVAARIMALVEKNSARFTKANANRQVRMKQIADLEAQVATKEATLNDLLLQLESKRAGANTPTSGGSNLPYSITPKTVDMADAVDTLNKEVLGGYAKAVLLVLVDDDTGTVVANRFIQTGKKSAVNAAQAELFSIGRDLGQSSLNVHHIYATDYAYPARDKLKLLGYTVTERFDVNEHIPDDVKAFLVEGQLYDLARMDGSGYYQNLRFTNYQANDKYTDRMEVVAVFNGNSTHFEENVARLSHKIAAKELVLAGSAPTPEPAPETTPAPTVVPPETPPTTDNATAEFLQSVIDGKQDMTASDFAQKLTALHEQTVGDEGLTQLFNQAVDVYAAMAMAQAKQALGH
ncbi:hypothetical protein [Hydromonas duriensis]|uniref:Defence against restriction A N-terminal domain-containing protein n=1 Tax=Hydromonas duriensis TaxID=1527608 RepID=A0A4R6Y6Z5_9BURK|nr:hypothetical protein [Hydromonas duriensis]TDR30332.1 hypothetical protein DFR44_1221 [Hydromonas duriensis]